MSAHSPATLWELILFLGLIVWHYVKPVVIVVLIAAAVIGWIQLIK
jgi:hypothetical protein